MSSSDIRPLMKNSIPEFQKYQHQFVEYLRNPLQQPESLPQRSKIYAKLLYSKIQGSLDNCFPISCQLLGATRWKQLIQLFIRDHRCQSPLYREIPDEFVDFLINEQTQISLPKFIVELVHYEWIELVLETEKPSQSTEFIPVQKELLAVIPVLNPVLHLLHYHYPVQKITPSDPYWINWDTSVEPYPQETIILAGIRDCDDNVQFIELNAVTTRLIELIQEQVRTGEQALLVLAAEMNYNNHESILPFGSEILKQLEEQHIIVGVKCD